MSSLIPISVGHRHNRVIPHDVHSQHFTVQFSLFNIPVTTTFAYHATGQVIATRITSTLTTWIVP